MNLVLVLFLMGLAVDGASYGGCGLVTYDGSQVLIAGGNSAQRGEVPWHAAIFSKSTSPYKQICGGSLVRSNIIISAAHCFWSAKNKQLPAKDYAVGVGKLYRPWNTKLAKEAAHGQRSDVKEIHLPVHFQGEEANNQDDIAIVVVSTKFQCTASVRPVCVDFDVILDRKQLQPGNNGKVAGWGLTSKNGRPSQTLKVVELPYIDTRSCIHESPYTFRPHITSDKFCAGYKNYSRSVCKGDSGGGLVFPGSDKGQTRYYLRGVASSAPAGDNKCSVNDYTCFTHILKHEHFIKDFWSEGNEMYCVSEDNFESREHKREGCGWSYAWGANSSITNERNGEVQYGEFPWMCAVLKVDSVTDTTTGRVRTRDVFVGDGALIHHSVVLSGGYFLEHVMHLRVRAGIENNERTTIHYPYQLREVATVETMGDAYVLLFLTAPMMPAPNVGMACLPPPEAQPFPPGTTCVATFWNNAEGAEYNYKRKLQKVEMSVIEHARCLRSIIQIYRLKDDYELGRKNNCVRQNGREMLDENICKDLSHSFVSRAMEWQADRYLLSGSLWFGWNCSSDPFWVFPDFSVIRTWVDEKVSAKGYDIQTYTIDL